MKKEILIKNQKICYTLKKNSKSRYLSLKIWDIGDLIVQVPKTVIFPEIIVENFIQKKATWILKKLSHQKIFRNKYFPKESDKNFSTYRETARSLVKKRIDFFNKFYNFTIKRITIRNQRTRWGSCSQKGNLNFNYRLALLPAEIVDYIVVHELCHLKEFNHSEEFWKMVEKTIPAYREIRKKIR